MNARANHPCHGPQQHALDAFATTGQSPGKRCARCHETKALTEFRSHAGKADGLYAYCRGCEAQDRQQPDLKARETARKAASERTWAASRIERRKARIARTPKHLHPTPSQLADLLLKRGFLCAYCGEHNVTTFDHIVPLYRGGAHTAANMAPACKRCNGRKATKTAEEFGFPTLVGQTVEQVTA